MKIRLTILDSNIAFIRRLSDAFLIRYSDKVEVNTFSVLDMAIENVSSGNCDVFIADSAFSIDVDKIPSNVSFAYLVDSKDVDSFNGFKTLGRYQKVDLIYREVLDLFSLCSNKIVNKNLGNREIKTICFTTPGAGVGNSSLAIGCAQNLAKSGKKVLYLDLQLLPTVDTFFSKGEFNLSDVIFALKSKKVNLSVKLQSCVQQSESGVFYFSQVSNPLDIIELSYSDKNLLLKTLQEFGEYEIIILDLDFSYDCEFLSFISQCDSVVFSSDGSETANAKLQSGMSAIEILQTMNNFSLDRKAYVVYNKFSNKISNQVENEKLVTLGGIPRFEHALNAQIVEQIAGKFFWGKLIE